MRKKMIIYLSLLIMMFSLTALGASDLESASVENELKELKIEDAIEMAQSRDKKLKSQKTEIELARVNEEAAKDHYFGRGWDYRHEEARANYSKATASKSYQIKNEDIIKEQIAFDLANRFDTILELEEQYDLAWESLKIQRQKVNHASKRESLGLASKVDVKTEEKKLEAQNKDIESLTQSIDTEYRKLNDAISGSEKRYKLIKENIYQPLDMIGSLEGKISDAVNSDLGLWLQEEIAESDKVAFIAPGPDGYAPTYTLYQQRKLSYEKALNDLSLNKEGKKEQVKQIYENILALELQHDKILMEIEENKRQYGIMEKRYKLGMITPLNLEELALATLQNKLQLSSVIRQHSQLKILFEKSYLSVSQM